MPIYLFDYVENGNICCSNEPRECSDDEIAKVEASVALVELRRGRTIKGDPLDSVMLVSRSGETPFFRACIEDGGLPIASAGD